MIVTKKRNALIIAQQLRQMNLLKYSKQYNVIQKLKEKTWYEKLFDKIKGKEEFV